jgi:hypothetical protein
LLRSLRAHSRESLTRAPRGLSPRKGERTQKSLFAILR